MTPPRECGGSGCGTRTDATNLRRNLERFQFTASGGITSTCSDAGSIDLEAEIGRTETRALAGQVRLLIDLDSALVSFSAGRLRLAVLELVNRIEAVAP